MITEWQFIIEVAENMMSVIPVIPSSARDSTRGLLGKYNDDPEDDLIPRNQGESLDISKVTTKQIYDEFCVSCKFYASSKYKEAHIETSESSCF